ncbi:EpsG family protein [Chryseobacterium suipulveris]|uniref:EpsG family protein n=1 Tax=Chryseobacterium suipulveris TaxID=2929800 RepID=A0ABY4BNZ5_9FLAO|nr:EpsG family protein [Chryseobacterium suipulveris]UOE40815.1 EpsG family protein [Chryseobacterium suipulveris]
MPILHPIFILIFIILLFASYQEVFGSGKKQKAAVWIVAFLIIIAVGLRENVGADYPVYKMLFSGFSLYTTYGDVWDKALFRPNAEEIEWIFVLINKIVFDIGFPFYVVTLIMAIITVTLKFTTIYENVEFPALALLFYFMPIMFFEDSGQMRQGLGIAVCAASFKFIKERNLWMFLLCLYIAIGFHKTSIVFLPAYWLVKIPMNSTRIFWVLVFAVLSSPFELYRFGGNLFSSLTPKDISGAYTGYLDDRYYGNEVETGLNDIVKILFIIVLIRYDKKGCEEVWWYEYMRNLAVFGMFLFYFFRSNGIFAVRLPGVYMFFVTMFCLPNLVYAVRDQARRFLYIGFVSYFVAMFFYFGQGNGDRGKFTLGRYTNKLW